MPQVRMTVCWPDASTSHHVSPSTIINKYFEPEDELPIADFVAQSEKAFEHASQRVKERFGFFCSQASESLTEIQQTAQKQSEGMVRVIKLEVMS